MFSCCPTDRPLSVNTTDTYSSISILYRLFESYFYHVAADEITSPMAASSVVRRRCRPIIVCIGICGQKYLAN